MLRRYGSGGSACAAMRPSGLPVRALGGLLVSLVTQAESGLHDCRRPPPAFGPFLSPGTQMTPGHRERYGRWPQQSIAGKEARIRLFAKPVNVATTLRATDIYVPAIVRHGRTIATRSLTEGRDGPPKRLRSLWLLTRGYAVPSRPSPWPPATRNRIPLALFGRKVLPEYPKDDGTSVSHAELGEQVAQVRPDRGQTDAHCPADLLVAQPGHQVADDLLLTGRQPQPPGQLSPFGLVEHRPAIAHCPSSDAPGGRGRTRRREGGSMLGPPARSSPEASFGKTLR